MSIKLFGINDFLASHLNHSIWLRNCNVENMAHEFFSGQPSGKTPRTAIEDIHILLLDESIVFEALQWVSGCERCSEHALIEFDYILDAVTGSHPASTEYVMCRPMKCPYCWKQITEKTKITVC